MSGQTRSVGYAILKLRSSITACCCAIGLCLIVQLIVWSLVSFTDLRTEIVEPDIRAPLIVEHDEVKQRRAPLTATSAISFGEVAEPITVLTAYDQFFHDFASLAQAVGTAACLVLIVLMLVGVILAAGEATSRIHLVVSAMIWTVLLVALTMPLGGILQLPWDGGALRPYGEMVAQVEIWRNGMTGTIVFWTRFFVLPLMCGMGCVLIMWRFGRGVEPLLPEEMHKLDPELDKEASNINVTSLHGGRSGAALSRMMSRENAAASSAATNPADQKPDPLPRAREVSAGQSPKRII